MHSRILACIALAFAGSIATAGQMELKMNLSRLNPVTFDPLPIVYSPDGSVSPGQPGYYVVDVFFTATKSGNDKGWFDASFDVESSAPGLALDYAGGWTPSNPTYDINGNAPGGVVPVYGINVDPGPSDLKGIYVSVPIPLPPPNDKRNDLGTPNSPVGYPTHLGTFGLTWDALTPATLSLTKHVFRFSQADNTIGPQMTGLGATQTFAASTVTPPVVLPEPPYVLLIGPNRTVSTTFEATDAETPNGPFNWEIALSSYVPLFPGAVNPQFTGSIDDTTGVFTWDATGFKAGVYTFNVTATDTSHLNSAPSPFVVLVPLMPEPSSLTLCAIALVALVSRARRHNS